MSWLPDRKILATGLSGILGWLLVLALGKAGIVLSMDQAAALIGLLMTGAGYLMPPSVQDIVKRVDAGIIELAGKQ